jgi:four helix bundle protein
VGKWEGEEHVIRSVKDLKVWTDAADLAMEVFRLSQSFPKEERYSLTDQIRRSSRSVAANIAEAWRKRRYPASFVSKFSDAEGEAAETQTWIEFARRCGYWNDDIAADLDRRCDEVLAQIVHMINNADKWCDGLTRPRG